MLYCARDVTERYVRYTKAEVLTKNGGKSTRRKRKANSNNSKQQPQNCCSGSYLIGVVGRALLARVTPSGGGLGAAAVGFLHSDSDLVRANRVLVVALDVQEAVADSVVCGGSMMKFQLFISDFFKNIFCFYELKIL